MIDTKTIKYLKKQNNDKMDQLIHFINQMRKDNPYDIIKNKYDYVQWDEQCNINFPILYLASLYLYIYAKKKGCTSFLFCTRDCCHWYKIFKKMFPDANSHYFHSSRIMLEKATGNKNYFYDQYVKTLIPKNDVSKIIYIDIHGSGKRIFGYFIKKFKKAPHVFMLSTTHDDYPNLPDNTRRAWELGKFINIVFNARGSPIEMLNYDNIGTLVDFNVQGPVRHVLEYDLRQINTCHVCINYIIHNMKNFRMQINGSNFKLKKLGKLINKLFDPIKNKKPIVSDYINHIGKHKENKLIKTNEQKYFFGITFLNVLSNSSSYGLIWNGKFANQACVIKMILLKMKKITGDKKQDLEFINYDDIDPFRHSEFVNKKTPDMQRYMKEVNTLLLLEKYGLAPKIYKTFIYDKHPHLNYGFIVMNKFKCTLKSVLLRRKLQRIEKKIVKNMINSIHIQLEMTHGDLKPSNIGVELDNNDTIIKSYVIDCDKVVFKKDCSLGQFNKLIEYDWHVYKKRSRLELQ